MKLVNKENKDVRERFENLYTRSRLTRTRTPDSFNKHAPGTSLFDGTEATPLKPARRTDNGGHHPPRARRRIAFGPSEQTEATNGSPRKLGGQRLAGKDGGCRRATEDGSLARPAHHLRRRSRSLSPRAVSKVSRGDCLLVF